MSKLSYEDKINIYLKKKNGQSRKSLSREYKVNELIIAYLYYLKINAMKEEKSILELELQ